MAAASRAPFGPCFISAGWDEAATRPPLVTVAVTRRLAEGDLMVGVAIVDRTCLGIKDANTEGPLTDGELEDYVDELRATESLQLCEPEVAQSVVFHAVDYAQRLGFAPHRDFRPEVFGPRPEILLATAFHNVPRPLFVSRPHDNDAAIIAQLQAAVGPGNFDATTLFDDVAADYDQEYEAEDEDDEDVIDVEAEPKRIDP
jgi:hypothetical protein